MRLLNQLVITSRDLPWPEDLKCTLNPSGSSPDAPYAWLTSLSTNTSPSAQRDGGAFLTLPACFACDTARERDVEGETSCSGAVVTEVCVLLRVRKAGESSLEDERAGSVFSLSACSMSAYTSKSFDFVRVARAVDVLASPIKAEVEVADMRVRAMLVVALTACPRVLLTSLRDFLAGDLPIRLGPARETV